MESKANSNEKRGRLDGAQRHRLKKLFHMRYTPAELAEEIGFNRRQIYQVYLPLGCPHERDSRGHIWIVGTEFRDWYMEIYKKRKLAENEAFCVSCKKEVLMINPKERIKEGLTYLQVKCPECDRTVSKITAMRRRTGDKSGKLEAS